MRRSRTGGSRRGAWRRAALPPAHCSGECGPELTGFYAGVQLGQAREVVGICVVFVHAQHDDRRCTVGQPGNFPPCGQHSLLADYRGCRYPLGMEESAAPDKGAESEPSWWFKWVMQHVGAVVAMVVASVLTTTIIVVLPLNGSEGNDASEGNSREADGESMQSVEPEPAGRELWTGTPETRPTMDAFAVTLNSLVCGEEPDETAYWSDRVQAELCTAYLTFTNRGNTARIAPVTYHYLWVGDNYFEHIGREGDAFDRAIFPDAMSDGQLYFDVPTGSAPSHLQVGVYWPDDEDDGAVFRLTNE